jgi:hypothetical protein
MVVDKIIVNIPKIYNFRMNNSIISEEKINNFIDKYSKFNVVINFLNKDYGPGTRLLGFLNSENNYILNYDLQKTFLVLLDDDVIYKPYTIEYFNNYVIKNINISEIFSYDVYNYKNIQIGQSVDGFFIKLNILDKFLDYYNVIKDQDYVNYQDDMYMSYYFYLINKSIKHILPPNNSLIYNMHDYTFVDALCQINDKYSRHNVNDKSFEILNSLNKNGYFDFLF